MKRYWINLVLEMQEYDEQTQRVVKNTSVKFSTAELTPEPAKYVRKTLSDHAAKISEAVEVINQGEVTSESLASKRKLAQVSKSKGNNNG